MNVAIAGFEKTGKTTLFSAITAVAVEATAGQTPETLVHEGVAVVPDARIDTLSRLFSPKKTTYATIEYLDLPGLSARDHGRNRKILDSLREPDLLINVVRAFDDAATVHPFETVDVGRDIRNFESELILVDHLFIEKRVERIDQNLKRGQKENPAELDLLKMMKDHLEAERALRTFPFTADHKKLLQAYKFVSSRPVIHVVNTGENAPAAVTAAARELASKASAAEGTAVISLCAGVEKEISELGADERAGFLAELGIEEPASNRLVRESYRLLGLISYFTVGEDEVRAWTIVNGMSAREAGGRIHSDIEKGFIRAEVVSYDAFMELGSLKAVKEKGLFRLEGKTYIVQDGDIMNFRFNV